MNMTRFIVAAIAAFAVTAGFDYLVHCILLEPMYEETANVWRSKTEIAIYQPFMLLSQMALAIVFTFIFTRHYENKGIAEGMRYGLYMGLFLGATQIGVYAYLPIPLELVLSWAVAALAWGVITGAVVALIYRK